MLEQACVNASPLIFLSKADLLRLVKPAFPMSASLPTANCSPPTVARPPAHQIAFFNLRFFLILLALINHDRANRRLLYFPRKGIKDPKNSDRSRAG